jgi:hypothetical protein
MRMREIWDRHGNLIQSVPDTSPREVSAEAFALRFTLAELAAVETSTVASVIAARVRLLARTEPLNLDSPELAGVLNLFVAVGILTAARVPELLA